MIRARTTGRPWCGAFALISAAALQPNLGSAEDSSGPIRLKDSAPDVVVPTTMFRPVQAKSLAQADYPISAINFRREGWALVSTMVDRNGKPYETAIMRSSGNEALDKAAISALEHSALEPAMSDGRPTESAYEVKYMFALRDAGAGASRTFVSAYEKFGEAMQGDDKIEAEAALKRLDAVNLYEDAFLGLAEYKYALKYGTQHDQISGLKRALANETAPKYLPKSEFEGALRSLLILDIKTNQFQEALTTWEHLQRVSTDYKTLATLKAVMDQVDLVRKDPRPYGITGELKPSASAAETMAATWFLDLFKPRFRIEVEEGHLAEIKLRCDKTFLSFPFDPGLEYHVESRFGKCEMQLLGVPGSKFTVIQRG
jgi:TonB family protein